MVTDMYSQNISGALSVDPVSGQQMPKYCAMVSQGLHEKRPGFTPLNTEIAITSATRLAHYLFVENNTVPSEDKKELFANYTTTLLTHVEPEKSEAVFRVISNTTGPLIN